MKGTVQRKKPYRMATVMKRELSVRNIRLAVLNILSALVFLFVPQFSCGFVYTANNEEPFSVIDLLKNGVSHRAVLIFAVVGGVLMTVFSAVLFLLQKVKLGRITAFFLPLLEIMLMFAVIFNLLILPGGENLFFSAFVTPVGLTVFFASLMSLAPTKSA